MHSFLVVSDDNSVHSFLKKSLHRDSIVHMARTTEEALQISLKEQIDVAFLDILLRDDANKLVEGLRQANIEPTIVALVPTAEPMLLEEALRVGAYELIEKPMKREALQHASKRALERQELKKELGFMQSQINSLKPNGKDNGSFDYASNKHISNGSLHLTYKEVFQKFSKVLTKVYDLRKLSHMTVEAISEIFKVGRVVFMMVDKEKGACRPYYCLGLDEVIAEGICFSTHDGVILWLTKNHQILNKDLVEREVAMNRLTRREALNIRKEMDFLGVQLCIPIFAKGRLVSTIALGNKITGKAFFDEDVELLSMLAGYVGMAVENALLYQEVYLRKIHNENVLENIPCGVIAIDNNCKVNTFNRSAAQMLNISSHDVLEKDVKNIGSFFSDIILRTLKDKKTYEMSEVVHPVTCSTYAVSTSTLLDTRGKMGAIMVFTDLSSVKRLESRVKDLEKQAFYHMLSKNMAHYVKNHLVSIKTFMDLFPKKRGEKEFLEKFSPIVKKEVDKLDLMVKKLTTLGENGSLVRRRFELQLLLDQVLESFGEEIAGLNIKLIKDYAEEPTSIDGDCEKLEEAFSNVILNAMEAMPNGGTLTVKLSRTSLDNQKLRNMYSYLNNGEKLRGYNRISASRDLAVKYVEAIIEDTGEGMCHEKLKSIFLPFYTTKVYNIGLGLSITRRIIEEHDGFIYVTTKERKGSNIHILLPLSDLQ